MDRNLTTDYTDYTDLDTKKDNTKIKTDVTWREFLTRIYTDSAFAKAMADK